MNKTKKIILYKNQFSDKNILITKTIPLDLETKHVELKKSEIYLSHIWINDMVCLKNHTNYPIKRNLSITEIKEIINVFS